VKVEQQTIVEADGDSRAHAVDFCALELLLELLGLPVHLLTDDSAGRAAHRCADDGALGRIAVLGTDDAAYDGTGTRTYGRAAFGFTQVGAADETRRRHDEARQDKDRKARCVSLYHGSGQPPSGMVSRIILVILGSRTHQA